MAEHKCNSCFYMFNKRDAYPCHTCEGYNKYVNRNVYIHKSDTEEMIDWVEEDEAYDGFYGGSEEYVEKANAVHSPKHYMLFEKEGIEVRHVIEKLVEKLDRKGMYSGMFISDYVQMMQYFMRFMDKNGKEDLEKGLWFFNRLLEKYE